MGECFTLIIREEKKKWNRITLTPWFPQIHEMMKLKENLKDPSLVSHFADYNASQYMYPFIIEKQLHSKLYQTATVLSFFHS